MRIGLKGLWSDIQKDSLRWKIDKTIDELKYAWQRAWKGYDNRELWGFDSMFLERTAIILEEYKKNHYGLWWCPEGYDWSKTCEKDEWFDKYLFSEEQMDAIIETLIFHLKMSDEDFVEKHLYGKNINDDDYVIGCRSKEDYIRIANVRKQNQDAAMDLLKLFMDDLWD